VPIFIATDSLLNGFHVLFEESVYRMEQAQARKLPMLLEAIAKRLDHAGKQLRGDGPVHSCGKPAHSYEPGNGDTRPSAGEVFGVELPDAGGVWPEYTNPRGQPVLGKR
jgi:hypothetical protein